MSSILKTPIHQKCAWKGVELRDKTDWVYHLPSTLLQVFDEALNVLAQKGLQAPHFSKADVPLTNEEVLQWFNRIADELENGYGFVVIKGLREQKYSEEQMTNIYWLLGLYLGDPVTQNAKGDLIGYVQNVGDLENKMTRVYETNAYLPYHTDMSDVVGLLSIRKAKQGGLSSIVSFASIYNIILEKYPEYLGYFYYPAWYDHLGEVDPSLSPIFSYYDGKLACRYLRRYIELGHERKGVPIAIIQKEALDLLDAISFQPELRLDMMLEPGDIQFCNNYSVMHSRTAFDDFDEPKLRRKLLRLWLKMPNARKLSPDFPGRNGIPKGLGMA